MNSGVITKVEYMPNTGSEFEQMDIIPHSGIFSEPTGNQNGNIYYSFAFDFKIAEVKPETDNKLDSMIGKRGIFRITDANNRVYTIGDAIFKANFTFTRRLDGTPGSFNGYDCSVTRSAPTRCPMV
ncbi:hypothetical protein [Mangrovibacterium sp.]|uniref:hypothetical protein n=1 Tax=Mangrovibacterium sp. TaxID=1961364 RepID=UPI003565B976